MKIFLALVFIVLAIVGIIRGSVFKGTLVKMKETADDFYHNYYQRRTDDYLKKLLFSGMMLILSAGILCVLELIFYMMVVSIPELTIPTIGMMLIFIINVVSGVIKKNPEPPKIGDSVIDKMRAERERAKRLADKKIRTPYGMFLKFLSLAYFVYALMVLIHP